MFKKHYFILLFFSISIYSQVKINGISFVASNREITKSAIDPVVSIHSNWVTLMPFAFMKSKTDTTIMYNDKRQWLGERKEGIEKTTLAFRKKGIKIMLKPQIWIGRGDFTGHISMKNQIDWIAFENNYEQYILEYAKQAQDLDCEMFCIGTELNDFVVSRPLFWDRLIKKIKKVYHGKITYAENWDTYKKVPFWSLVDYIGIDAYFPLAIDKTPSIKTIEMSWKPIINDLKNLNAKYKKQILFTEYGYQSKDYVTQEPWEHSKQRIVNLEGQKNALTAILNQFWKQDWFAGGFLWKWYDNHNEVGGKNDDDYTIQNKPSEDLVKKFYIKY
jgi:hypothetical protein